MPYKKIVIFDQKPKKCFFANRAPIDPNKHEKGLFRPFGEVSGENLVSGKKSEQVTFWEIFVKIT